MDVGLGRGGGRKDGVFLKVKRGIGGGIEKVELEDVGGSVR